MPPLQKDFTNPGIKKAALQAAFDMNDLLFSYRITQSCSISFMAVLARSLGSPAIEYFN